MALSEVLDPFCRHGDELEDEGPYSAYHNRCTYSDCSGSLALKRLEHFLVFYIEIST